MNPKPLHRSRTIAASLALAIVVVADVWLDLDSETAKRLIRSLEIILGAAVVIFGRAAVADASPPPRAPLLLAAALLLPTACTCPHLESAHRAIQTVERDYDGLTPLSVHGPEELRASRLRMLREARLTLETARGE
jgi:hypothetical protein